MHVVYGVQVYGGRKGLMIGYDPTGQLILLDPFIIGEEPILNENRLFFDHGTKHLNHFFRTGLGTIDTLN